MNLLIDIGNTFTHFAVHNGKRIAISKNCLTADKKKVIKYLKSIQSKFNIDTVGIASVSPESNKVIEQYTRRNFRCKLVSINSKTALPVSIKIKNPHTLGADRICNAVFGNEIAGGKSNVLVIDLGTANTYDLVLKNGDFVGGIIAPGIMTSSKALNLNTANLPLLEYRKLSARAPVIGKNTFEAIQSGLVNYMKYATEGIVAAVKKKHKGKLTVVLTGGSAILLKNNVNFEYIYKENTVLEGINVILKYQNASK